MQKIKLFFQKEPVLAAASILALLSMLFVPPDSRYIKYIDFKTLLCLLCLMIALKGIEREGLITAIAVTLASKTKRLKHLAFILVFICFFTSMLMTNDVALIALVPITLVVLPLCGLENHTAFIIILQTLAANIGSSLTPMGNPQNLFLFMRYGFSLGSFIGVMLPFVLFAGLILVFFCFAMPNQGVIQKPVTIPSIRNKFVAAYSAMFILALAAILGVLSYTVSVIIILATTFLLDRRTLARVDYCLLLTFCVIFIFVGNIARIEILNQFISTWVQKDTMLTAIFASQLISNVPAAVMLSEFTKNSSELLLGVNIGGMGTLIASMASVISYKLFAAFVPKGVLRYLAIFTMLNGLILILSIVFQKLWW